MDAVDDFTFKMTVQEVKDFVNQVLPLLSEVLEGKHPNWRHDVYNSAKAVYIAGHRVLKHHLTRMASGDTGDFREEATDAILEVLQIFNPDDFHINLVVLLPTVYMWIVVCLGKLTGAQARYYLANGGNNTGNLALQRFEERSSMYLAGHSFYCFASYWDDVGRSTSINCVLNTLHPKLTIKTIIC